MNFNLEQKEYLIWYLSLDGPLFLTVFSLSSRWFFLLLHSAGTSCYDKIWLDRESGRTQENWGGEGHIEYSGIGSDYNFLHTFLVDSFHLHIFTHKHPCWIRPIYTLGMIWKPRLGPDPCLANLSLACLVVCTILLSKANMNIKSPLTKLQWKCRLSVFPMGGGGVGTGLKSTTYASLFTLVHATSSVLWIFGCVQQLI